MGTESTGTDLEAAVQTFLLRELPQIQAHGGDATVLDVDPEAGTAHIHLSGACSGCGISPMTIQAIKARLPREVPEIDTAEVDTGPGGHDDGHDGMAGHPAGGGITMDYEGEIPEWRTE